MRSVVALLLSTLLWSLGVLACGEDPPPPSDALPEDARALAAILDSDPTGPAIDDADHAVDTDRPVMAAGILTATALPATEQQIRRIEALHPSSPEGRTLRSRALRVHRARLTGLTHYRDALARGPVEDDALVEGLHETSVAERDLLSLRNDLAAHAPLPEGPEDLSGLPPVLSGERIDDGDTTDEPTEGVDDPADIGDPLPEM